MSDDDVIIEAARAIRAYLPELVGTAEAETIDRQLVDLLARAQDDPACVERILELLGRRDATAEWTAVLLESGYPPDVRELVEQRERYAGLAGHGEPPPAPRRYACPEGDFVRWRRGAEPLPTCPEHGLALEPSEGAG